MGLRLLHAISTVNPAAGGPVEGVRQLTAVNTLYGHTVEVLTLDAPDSPWLAKLGVPFHALGPAGSYGYTPKYVKWLREHAAEYDMIIVNGVWGYNAFGTWLALRNTKVPYTVFTHGMLDPWFKHRYPLKHLKKWLYWPWGLYPVLRDAEAVFFTCQRERELARESFWLYDCNEVIVRYGTEGIPDPDRDYRADFFSAHPELAGKRMFLFFGRVHPKKGPDLMIRAVAKLKNDGYWDENSMRMVMAGPADSAYADELRALVRKEGIEKSTYWTGMLVGNQKWGVIQGSEAFVLPSHQENFGIAVAEALSASTPVLITHGVNISPEIGCDGAGLVDEDTVLGTYRLIRKWLLISQEERDQMCIQARQTFLNRFTAAVGAKDMLRSVYLILSARKMEQAFWEQKQVAARNSPR
jgi:glycosyltransferase involved in cell wall biosynthesis